MSETTGEVLKKLDTAEAKVEVGLPSLTPKQKLLDAQDVQKKFPGKRVRWVSATFAEKMTARKLSGYEAVPEKDGGRRVGNLVLMFCPVETYNERVRSIRKLNEERLQQHNREMEMMAESQARFLRDKMGITVTPERLLVKED